MSRADFVPPTDVTLVDRKLAERFERKAKNRPSMVAGLPPQLKAELQSRDQTSNRRALTIGGITLLAVAGMSAALVGAPLTGRASLFTSAWASGQNLIAGGSVPATLERRADAERLARSRREAMAAAAEERTRDALRDAQADARASASVGPAFEPIGRPVATPAPSPNVVTAREPPVSSATPTPSPVNGASLPMMVAALEPTSAVKAAGRPTGEDGTVAPSVAKSQSAIPACIRDVALTARATIVAFDVRSAVIAPIHLEQLKRFATILTECPQARLEIGGHTDLKGQQEKNFQLSWDRAEAVLQALKANGIDGSRFTVVGYGPRQPLSQTTDTTNYNPVDRRVEFAVR